MQTLTRPALTSSAASVPLARWTGTSLTAASTAFARFVICPLESWYLIARIPTEHTRSFGTAPPRSPSSITVPSSVRGGESLSISWGASTDEDGNLSGYILERQVNGGAWAQVYKGINRSYTDAITFGWTSVAYRVKAYDSAGAESAYNTSATRTVVNNHAPVISGTDSNLGTKTAAFTQSYSVTDKDSGQTLTVTEYIDGTQKRSYTGDKRTDLFVQHHRRRVGETVERVPYAENRCGGQLRRKCDPDVYVRKE